MSSFSRGFLGCIAICLCLVGLPATTPVASEQQPPLAEWTVLVFMNGDNNLEEDALINFQQIAAIGSTALVNVLVQLDRNGNYAFTQPQWTQTLRFRVTKDMAPLPKNALQDLGEVNMGDPAALSDFVQWGKSAYPAKRYMLVIWDHGQGWRVFNTAFLQRHRELVASRAYIPKGDVKSLRAQAVLLRNGIGVATTAGRTAPFRSAPGAAYRSISHDETNNDVLYGREVQDSLTTTLMGEKLDVIGFDACLMAMLETAYSVRNVARYMVGSEELEPGLGWKYDQWLEQLINKPTMDGRELGQVLVNTYAIFWSKVANPPELTTTLSAIDLSQIPDLATAMSALSNQLTAKIDQELQNVISARKSILNYAPGRSFFHVDLQHFLQHLSAHSSDKQLLAQIAATSSIYERAIIANYAGALRAGGGFGSNGMAIYFPASNTEYVTDPYAEGGYEKTNTYFPVEFVSNESWTDFLHEYWKRVP